MEVPVDDKSPAPALSAFSDATNRYFWIAVGFIVVLCLALPGNTQFICDEALLMGNALLANSKGMLAPKGLIGTAGVHYGPLPTWFYQLLFLFTKNLILMSLIKNILNIALMVTVMTVLAKTLKMNKFPILIVLACPVFYMVHRALWDDGFMIGLSAAIFLAMLLYSSTHRSIHFVWGTVVATILVYTQIKAVFVILAFFGLTTVFEWKRMIKSPAIIASLVISGLAVAPYGMYILHNFESSPIGPRPNVPGALISALSGARVLSFWDVGSSLAPEIYTQAFVLPVWLTKTLVFLSMLVVPFFIAGVVLSARSLWQTRKNIDLHGKATLFCLTTIALFVTFFVLTRRCALPHYFTGAWIPYFYFVWYAIDRMVSSRWGIAVFVIQLSSLVLLLACFIIFIDLNGGTRSDKYGATLSNQIEVARQIGMYSRTSKVVIKVQNYIRFPNTYSVLQYIVNNGKPRSDVEAKITLDYLDTGNPYCGRIAVRVTPRPQRQ